MSFLAGLYDGILIIDPKGYLLKSNERACEIFNCSEADLWGINCSELIPQLNAQVLYKIRAQIEERRFTVVSAVCKRLDETEFPAEIAISRITMNNDINMVLSIRNSERRSKEYKKNKLRDDAIKYAGVGIISCNSDGIIEYANRSFLRIINAENEKIVLQHNISDFCLNTDKTKVMLESPLPDADWYGSLDLKTLSDVEIRVQVTSSLSGTADSSGKKSNIIITMTLIPAAAVSVA
jgi:PAS domain S-box-containing protein